MLNTLRCINPLEKRILDPRYTSHFQGHLVQCPNVLHGKNINFVVVLFCFAFVNPHPGYFSH